MGFNFDRKDSFITHRAFCDALAEENARFGTTAIPTTNILPNFINNNINNPQTAAAARVTHPHLSPIFPAEFGSESVNNFGTNPTGEIRPRLPLWLDPANSHQLNSNNIPFMTATAGNSSGFPDLLQTAATTATLFGQASSAQAPPHHQWLNTNFPAMSSVPRGLKEEEELSKRNNNSNNSTNNNMSLSESMTSSSLLPNNQNLQLQGPAHMSATALLQKAAQMGSTRSNPTPFNGSAFGLMTSLSSSNSQKQVLFRQPVNQQSTAENNFNELVNSLQASSDNNNSNNGPAVLSSPSSFKSLDQFNLKQAAAQSSSANNNNNNENGEHSLTRDFLGVGGDGHIHGSGPNFFQQELEKFASMGSAMNLSQFSGHH